MSASPVTVNPTEDAFYEKVEASIQHVQVGYWWATGPNGRKLLVVDTDKTTGGWMVRLADSIHGWHQWFKPDLSVWKNWIKL